MANKTINDFTAKTALATTDYFLIQEVGGTTKRVSAPNISSCGQLAFPATQNASSNANTLDDYEEGTFTPTIFGSTSVGTGTYSTQTGIYLKVGRWVFIDLVMTITAHTGTGSTRITGFPFNIHLGTSAFRFTASTTNLPYSGTVITVLYDATTITLAQSTDAGSNTAFTLESDTAYTVVIQGFFRSDN